MEEVLLIALKMKALIGDDMSYLSVNKRKFIYKIYQRKFDDLIVIGEFNTSDYELQLQLSEISELNVENVMKSNDKYYYISHKDGVFKTIKQVEK